ncbi:unnamed protein product, partial [Phaeothamnion confervicola]
DVSECLRTVFGHTGFRDGQAKVTSLLLARQSCAAVFPTGLGKSLCYQLPAVLLARRGLGMTLVVSPLVALMKDQVEALQARGVACARLDGTLDAEQVQDTLKAAHSGDLALLYVSPERFNNERFLRMLSKSPVAVFVVDEAHCISEWGHNFRPDYLRLSEFARAAGAPLRLALTATATPKVAADMAERLAIPPDNVVRLLSHRPNLRLLSVLAPDGPEERFAFLAQRLRLPDRPQRPILVYVTLQATAEAAAAALVAEGFETRAYHAGMAAADREDVQNWFMQPRADGAQPVVVGTLAFGMGIDKSDIGGVYHLNLPRSLEEYAQGVGRSGRDGRPAVCEALVSPADVPILKALVYGNMPSPAAVAGLLEAVF